MAIEHTIRWTKGRVVLPKRMVRAVDGQGIQARYYILADNQKPTNVPANVPVGLKVYGGEETRDTRDKAYAMQAKLARHLLAPQVFGKVAVYTYDDSPAETTFFGHGLVTEHIMVGEWSGSPIPSRVARDYLMKRLPGVGDMHEGNYGWNPRNGCAQLIDMGDHGIRHIGWTRVPAYGQRANRKARLEAKVVADEVLARRADKRRKAHERRKAQGDTCCRTCGRTLR